MVELLEIGKSKYSIVYLQNTTMWYNQYSESWFYNICNRNKCIGTTI
mgnify:CR=1 FL=1